MITSIRKYLLQDTELVALLNDAIFFIHRPLGRKDSNYVTYNYKVIKSGHVQYYMLTVVCKGNDLTKLMQIQDRIIYLLDDFKGEAKIKDENNIIRAIKLLNGGGQVYDEETNEYVIVNYFQFII